MIDKDGFRANVGMIVTNGRGQLLWAHRLGSHNAWQFPQGGILADEQPLEAMYRELKEELGIERSDVTVITESQRWLRYRLPIRFQRRFEEIKCIGQKQKWFLLELIGEESVIRLDLCEQPEFDQWHWVNYWFPLQQVIFFKRAVYRRVLEEFAPLANK